MAHFRDIWSLRPAKLMSVSQGCLSIQLTPSPDNLSSFGPEKVGVVVLHACVIKVSPWECIMQSAYQCTDLDIDRYG